VTAVRASSCGDEEMDDAHREFDLKEKLCMTSPEKGERSATPLTVGPAMSKRVFANPPDLVHMEEVEEEKEESEEEVLDGAAFKLKEKVKSAGNVFIKFSGYGFVKRDSPRPHTFTVFRIDSQIGSTRWVVFRRYSAFRVLLDKLVRLGAVSEEDLPVFSPRSHQDMKKEFIEKRAEGLQLWLRVLVRLWKVTKNIDAFDSIMCSFLADEANESPIQASEKTFSFSPCSPDSEIEEMFFRSCFHHDFRSEIGGYKLKAVIGKGSFGLVFMAEPAGGKNSESEPIAIKALKVCETIKRKQQERVAIERKCLSLLHDCPFVVKLHASLRVDKYLLLVQEFCNGGELYYLLEEEGKLSSKVSRFFIAECALALDALHRCGIVYRDFKPENVMITHKGHIKLIDFGLAKMGIFSPHEGARSYVGTTEYLAPEMIKRQGHGTAVDYWGLGMVFYEMLTGLPPWYTRNKETILHAIQHEPVTFPSKEVTRNARSLICGLLEKDPAKRLGSKRGITELSSHPYFAPLDFTKVLGNRIKPPFVPKVHSMRDLSRFDKEFTCTLPELDIGCTSPRALPPKIEKLWKDFDRI